MDWMFLRVNTICPCPALCFLPRRLQYSDERRSREALKLCLSSYMYSRNFVHFRAFACNLQVGVKVKRKLKKKLDILKIWISEKPFVTSYVRINLPLFSTVLPSNSRLFLSCRPFVVIKTFSAGLVGVEEIGRASCRERV